MDTNDNNDKNEDNNIKISLSSKPWYHVDETSDLKSLTESKIPIGISLDKLHDTVASYCFVANESRIKATYYQHQLQCERTRHTFDIELLEKRLQEANDNYDNEYKLRLLLENELNSNQIILYQRNECLTKQDKIIRSNEEGLDRANNRIQLLNDKIDELEKENKILKISYNKEQIDHILTTEKLNNEVDDNEQKSVQIKELTSFKLWANEEISYLKDKLLHDHNNLLSLTNNYCIVSDKYDELCKDCKLVNKWINDVLSYVGIAPEIYDTDGIAPELSLLLDREGGDNSIISISNEKTDNIRKNMIMIRSIYRDVILRKELALIFDRIEQLTNDEINFLFTKRKYYQLITKDQISLHFNHFWIDFATSKDDQLQDIKRENNRINNDMNDLRIENKKLIDQAIENNTEMLLHTLLQQTAQIKTLLQQNAQKDKTINRNKQIIEKLKVFENSYNNIKADNDKNVITIKKQQIRLEELTSTIDNKDAARADENQNSIIIQNLVLAINSDLIAFKNRISHSAERDTNISLSQVEDILKGNNKLSTFEKTLITDSVTNIQSLWKSIENAISLKNSYNNVVSNIKVVSSELHDTKSFSIRETRRMSILYEEKLEELRNNDTANHKLKIENNELLKVLSEKDKNIASLTTEVNNNISHVQSAVARFRSYLSAYMTCSVIAFVIMFRIITIFFNTTYVIPQKVQKIESNIQNKADDKEYEELSNQVASMHKTIEKLNERTSYLLTENERLIKDKNVLVKFKEQFIDSLEKNQTSARLQNNKEQKIEEKSKPETLTSSTTPTTPTNTYANWKLQKSSFLGKRLEKLTPNTSTTTIKEDLKREARHIKSIQVINDGSSNVPTSPPPSKKSIRASEVLNEEQGNLQ